MRYTGVAEYVRWPCATVGAQAAIAGQARSYRGWCKGRNRKNNKNRRAPPLKSLLYPAIALMNRLSFGMKFSLISILFFLPMLVTNYYLVRDSYPQFHATRTELQSLELLGSSLALRGDVETLGNLVQINAVLGQSGKAEDVEAQIASVEQQVQSRLSGLIAMTGDEAQAKAFDDKRSEMLDTLKAAQSETSLLSKVALFDKLLGQAQVLSKVIASQAGLSQDSDSAIRQLSELMTTVTPQVTQTLGEGRAIGSYSLGQGFVNSASSARFDDLLLKLEKLGADYSRPAARAAPGRAPFAHDFAGVGAGRRIPADRLPV
ncbi:hypothetical protein D3C79_618790 [compost metagenome]